MASRTNQSRAHRPGEVDERSIEDVLPSDLRGFTQCHFFAGVGVWSHALRQAGWEDDRPVWTGSAPCQPFSAAGKRGGVADERHLWPFLYHYIAELRPLVFFGEQVASKDGLAWFDTVSDDLEAANYTIGSADLCAAGFGAPHIRQRLYFVADSNDEGSQGRLVSGDSSDQRIVRESGLVEQLADADGRDASPEGLQRGWEHGQFTSDSGIGDELSNTLSNERRQECEDGRRISEGSSSEGLEQRPLHGSFWSECDWIPCIDGKARPVESGTFPLAHGATNRVGRLRGYGNALCAPVAQGFIESYLEISR